MSQSETLSGVIFVMIGPGGAGKNAIMEAIIAQSTIVRQLPTATTRPMRANEKQGREHLFVSDVEFRQMIENNELLEYQEVTPGRFYGIPLSSVRASLSNGEARIADIDVLGAQELARAFPQNVVQVFVTVPGGSPAEKLAVLKTRMENRSDETNIEERLSRATILEFPYAEKCDYVIVNETLEYATVEVEQLIQQELRNRQIIGELS